MYGAFQISWTEKKHLYTVKCLRTSSRWQNSGSLQQDSSRTASGLRLGFMCTAPYDDVNTTRRTPMSAAAFITFLVPSIATGTRFCSTSSAVSGGNGIYVLEDTS